MIDVKELRVGNWIIEDDSIGDEIDLTYKQVDIYDFYGIQGDDRYKPIPLTPEILEMAGFKKHDGLMWAKHYKDGYEGFSLYCSDAEIVQAIKEYRVATIRNTDFNSYSYIGEPLKYLHELQNRFYSMTRIELQINLTEAENLKSPTK